MVDRSLAFNERQERESINVNGAGRKPLAQAGLILALLAVCVGGLVYWLLS